MTNLAAKKCVACDGATARLKGAELKKFQKKLGGNWHVTRQGHLEKEFEFKDFKKALAFTNRVGKLAEKLFHHPDIYLAWGLVRVMIWTHKVSGLTESDFILAAKIDKLK